MDQLKFWGLSAEIFRTMDQLKFWRWISWNFEVDGSAKGEWGKVDMTFDGKLPQWNIVVSSSTTSSSTSTTSTTSSPSSPPSPLLCVLTCQIVTQSSSTFPPMASNSQRCPSPIWDQFNPYEIHSPSWDNFFLLIFIHASEIHSPS